MVITRDIIREKFIRLELDNLASYLHTADLRTLDFEEVRSALAKVEELRNAHFFKQGSR